MAYSYWAGASRTGDATAVGGELPSSRSALSKLHALRWAGLV